MKANVTRGFLIRAFLLILLSLYFLLVFGQPDYTFQSGSLISGTANQVGAVYKYTNVRAGVDADVTIVSISPGITVLDFDAGSGYPEALQPTLRADAYTTGHMEMYFQLFVAGTSTPYTALEVPATCIDVDGIFDNDGNGNPLHEYDEVNLGGGYADFSTLGGELTVSQTGNWFNGKNIGGVDYPGRDTTAKSVMFTVVNANISTFTIRVGIDNQSDKESDRLRSVYFKKFIYPNSVLSSANLLSFKGNSYSGKINLDWSLATENPVSETELQRSYTGNDFKTIATFINNMDGISKTRFNFTDLQNTAVVYYRLKLVTTSGKSEYSNILYFKKSSLQTENTMKVYPTVVTGSQFSVAIGADAKQESLLQMIDYSGRIVYQKKIQLEQGNNSVVINDFNTSLKGNFVIVTKSGSRTNAGKIIIQ